jgi:uncharacterized protein YcbX
LAAVQELWRYPVASVGGERVKEIEVGLSRIKGDREFLLADLVSGEVAAPEKLPRWRPALHLSASWDKGGVIAGPSWSLSFSDPTLDDVLSSHFGFRCGLRRKCTELRTRHGPMLVRPRYEVSPLHIVSAVALAELEAHLPGSRLGVRRFRPNLVVDADIRDDEAVGRKFQAGLARGVVTEATKRCGMTMIAQTGLPEDPEILRTILRKRNRCLGVYATVSEDASISVGDAFTLA